MIAVIYRVHIEMGDEVADLVVSRSPHREAYQHDVLEATHNALYSESNSYSDLEEVAEFDNESDAYRCQTALRGVRTKYIALARSYQKD